MSPVTRESDVEQAALELFEDLGWSTADVMEEVLGEDGTLGRETRGDVVLLRRLRPALEKLNPGAPAAAIDLAIEALVRDRSAMSLVHANREAYKLIKEGVPVRAALSEDEGDVDLRVRVVDWDHPEQNDFFLVQQLWVQGETYLRRADLVGFVNGLPLVFIELKGIDQNVEHAYKKNFRDYLGAVPQLFWWNALVILSNGFESRVGSITGSWDHFKEWKRIEREDEPARVGLEVIVRGLCDKTRLLDVVESFTLFSEQKSDVAKIVGQNHQFLGVNNAIAAVRKYQLASAPPGVPRETVAARRRLGVFWHTQGSGKSFSMVFFSQKILRKLPGNWTFVIVTDREDLDAQIYKTFAACGAVPPPGKAKKGDHGVQARTAEHLKQLLTEDHRYVFTLIQKFRTDVKGAAYPKLSDRSDIIVIADEAHRSQYDTFALNLRNALPNAAFIGFTGTPLMAGEEKTREVFGDYVSVYNFRQAIADKATVPLYYEARIPELQLSNDDLADDLTALLDEADLDEEQQKKVEREFARQYHLVTREDRLDTIAADLVRHFLGLARGTKAMVVAIDKLTAVRMHDKVKAAWKNKREELALLPYQDEVAQKERLATLAFMDETDMAVVVSQAQNEVDAFKKKGLDIAPHRQRMIKEDLDTKFKDASDPLRIVFVCAMWMTGFDVPSCGVVYLDKPMKNHTLMQTIARANRVFEGKVNGLIVDYIGVFRNLQRALAIYGSDAGGGVGPGDTPVQPKEVQLEELRAAIAEAKKLAEGRGVDLESPKDKPLLTRLKLLADGVEKLLHPADVKKTFLRLTDHVDRLYRAVGLDDRKKALAPDWGVLTDLAARLRSLQQPVDISKVMEAVERLLDESIDAQGYVIREVTGAPYGGRVHLGGINFAALARFFEQTKLKASTAEVTAAAARQRVETLVRLNPTRRNLRDQLEALIDDYNEGAHNAERFFADLITFMKDKVEPEERRTSAEGLTPEQLALHDLLVVDAVTISAEERAAVKKIARELPKKLSPKLVIDWRKTQRARAAVKAAIRDELDELPEAYGPEAYTKIVEAVYEHVYESYWGEGKSKYAEPLGG
ncbi:Type I restriction-modification system, restriction subunit R [Minicystis rosea]|nr:Type I restriction-modification system, restriction subunit R [Minicystis rosea]